MLLKDSRSTLAAVASSGLFVGVLMINSFSPAYAQSSAGYQQPPAPLQAIVEQLPAPSVNLSPRRDLALMVKTPSLPSITEVAQPELKLAGLRINPRTYSQSRFSFGEDVWLMSLATRQEMKISGLPPQLKLAAISWSPDQKSIAFTHVSQTNGVELWLIDVATHSARKLSAQPLNTVYGRGFSWLPDGKRLLVRLRLAGQGAAPTGSTIPQGPNTQDALAGASQRQIRTLQDLLKNENDAQIFDHYTLTQLALIDLTGSVKSVGEPERYAGLSVSPDGKNVLTQVIERPYSYIVESSSFPHRIEVRDLTGATPGRVVHTLAKLPLEEGLPPGHDSVSKGVRDVSWRADAPATLVWAEAQDGGDAAKAAAIRDIVFTQAAPFADKPRELIKLATRYS
ncbi:MAG: S9 family peptidase, partial [Casimicrobium sp.]